MDRKLTRREFVTMSAVGAAGFVLAPSTHAQNRERPPALPSELVNQFVKVAHSDLEQVQELLEAQPTLLNASWDWGGGDFETGIGGAGHMGRRDIALYLLDNGARMDIFVAAMLGEIAIVRATLNAYPDLMDSKGPHGISLMAHAEAGGADAGEVAAYLERLTMG